MRVFPTEIILASSLVIAIALVSLWDIYLIARPDGHDTVSTVVGSWTSRFPVLTFGAGVVVGHLLWPR